MQIDRQQLEQRALINNFLMRAALPLGLFFVFEYMFSVWSSDNLLLAMLRLPMLVLTPVLLFLSMRTLRDKVMGGAIGGFQAWVYGVQMMLFAALVEAAWIYVYNEFIAPDNLYEMQTAAIAQYEQSAALFSESPVIRRMNTMVAELKDAPVPSAIEAAVQMVSNDLFIAMLYMIPISLIIKRKKQTTE